MGAMLKIRTALWGAPAATKEERRLILKLDLVILSFCCLMYWVNYLDRSNLSNAYTSGMKEDLKMYGTELNQISTIFYAGYFCGQIPNNIAIQIFKPRYYFPTVMLMWGVLCMSMAFVHHSWQLMIIRFFQALLEASTFPGVQYILGAWYKPEELGKRTAIFTSAGLAGSMFSGFLQGGVYDTMNGKNGLAGWRWLFIIDFLITIPIAIYGFIIFPDTPSTSQAKYLSPEEKLLAQERLPEVTKVRGELGWGLLKRVLSTYHFYAFVALWIFGSNTEMFGSNAVMNVWLKTLDKYSVAQLSYIPTSISGMGIVATLILGWYSDITKKSWHVGVFLGCTAVISGAIMLNPPNEGAKMFALVLGGCQYAGQTLFFAWANNKLRDDDAKRGFILASMNTFAIAVSMFWNLLFYNTEQAPMWREGSIAMICMGLALGLCTLAVQWKIRRDTKIAGVIEGGGEQSEIEEVKGGVVESKTICA